MPEILFKMALSVGLLLAVAGQSSAAEFKPFQTVLTNDFTVGKCLEAVGNHQVKLAPCNNKSKQQQWTVDIDPGVDEGYFILTNLATKECLVNNGRSVKTLPPVSCEGQGFYVTPHKGNNTRHYFHSGRFGDKNNLCLDVINDGVNDKVHMTTCGNYTGQAWQ